MKLKSATWWSERDTWDVLAVIFIAVCVILVLVNLSMYPVYLDIPYHMAVTRGFQEAGGVTTWDFWDYAPAGRPHIYPPLLHVGMSMLQDMGLSAQATATLVCVIMFPLILLSLWWAMRKLFGPRAAFYALVLAGVPYAFFYQTGITIAASLVLALTPLVFLALEKNRGVTAVVLLAMCLYSHLILGHLVALALFIYLLHRRDAWKKILAVLAAAYVLYLPWGIVVLSNLGSFTASEPGMGSDFALHLLLWGLAAAGFMACYFRRKQYYLLPAYLLSMVPIAFFYSHRFWEGHIFLPLAMLGGVALDGLHAFLSRRLSRRAGTASYARAAAGLALGGLLLLVFFADPVLASTQSGPLAAAAQGRIEGTRYPGTADLQASPADSYPPGGRDEAGPVAPPRAGPAGGLPADRPGAPARRTLLQLRDAAGSSLRLSLQPTTFPVLLGLEEVPRLQLGAQEVFGKENEDLMAAIARYSEEGDVVFAPEGRLGDLIYAMTGRYVTQGMFHEVQPEELPQPALEADLAVVPVGAVGLGGAVPAGSLPFTREEGWTEVACAGRYLIMRHDDPETAGGETGSAALPMWVAYALLVAAAVAIFTQCLAGRDGVDGSGGLSPTFPPRGPSRGGAGMEKAAMVLIPARDEEENVGEVVDEIRGICPGLDILVVDDGSRDGTGRKALEAGAMVLRLEPNRGVGEAERRGLAYAFEHGYAYAVRLDGDGQHPAACIGSLLAPLRRGEAEVVVGSRFLAGGGEGCRVSWPRRLGMAYFRFALRLSTSRRFSDPTSGCRAYSRAAMLFLCRVEPRRYPEVTSLRLLACAGLTVNEAPVEMRPRRSGRSSIGPREAIAMALRVSLDLMRPARTAGALPAIGETRIFA